MCKGKVTSRKNDEDDETCSMCGGRPIVMWMTNRQALFVPLVRLKKFKTTIANSFRLCERCLAEDAILEVEERERLKK